MRPMESTNKPTLSIALVVLAAVFVVLAVLYALGVINVLVSSTQDHHHYKHAILLIGLAVVSLIGANFARPRPSTS